MKDTVLPASIARRVADEANFRDALVARINTEIKRASEGGQYTITVDVESRVPCKQEVMDELRNAGYAISGTRGVKTFRVAWK